MLTTIHPKLPMRNKEITRDYYVNSLGFRDMGTTDYEGYLMLGTDDIDTLYQSLLEKGVAIHPAGALARKPWGQQEFALLDPDNNLLTFGQSV
ncbi:VOC family protein [Chitinophaga pendula]|uniref:VOC family protein n=1 Tax=Chitinophaga TaxID=79328 RepID=UPI000BAEE1A1|nr:MULTISPECIES: VOC family protein [Chitinophaga]ASZ12178.1 glyoxalase/bleomycin resistance/extradiol dioxygenase family protein [Chitinophaga sp. MD30]UCJ04793.1 VOC family protein [Chitinophaga pendula]